MPSKSKTNRQDRGPLTRIREGVVISDSRDKTRTVSCQFRWQHPNYGKIIMRDSKFHVHDPTN
jgi:ribosomal protein S17